MIKMVRPDKTTISSSGSLRRVFIFYFFKSYCWVLYIYIYIRTRFTKIYWYDNNIYSRTLMPKWILMKFQSNFIEIALRHGYSPMHKDLLYIARTPFPRNTCGGLLLIKKTIKKILLMLTNKLKKKQRHGNRQKGKRKTFNDNSIKKEIFWSLVILCRQKYQQSV